MIYEQSTLYKFGDYEVKALLHKELTKKDLLILIKQDAVLEPELLEMMDKMTAALKIQRAQVEYLTFSKDIQISALASQYQAKNILCFGAEAQELGIFLSLKMYQFHQLENFQILLVNQIIDVYNNQALKAKLWNELKTIAAV